MKPLTQGQETPLPLIQPSRSASAPPVRYENDKTKEGRSYEQYRPVSTADDPTRCTNQNPAMDSLAPTYKTRPGLWLCYTCVDMSIFDEHPVEEDTHPGLLTKIREQCSLSGKLCEERSELWNVVRYCERDMLQEEVAFGCTWGHHNEKRVKWMEKMAAKQKELEATYETITALMERVAKFQVEFRNSEKARLDAVLGRI